MRTTPGPGVIDDGSVYLRVQMSCEFWGMSDPFPRVRSALPDDDVLEIGALGQSAGREEETAG